MVVASISNATLAIILHIGVARMGHSFLHTLAHARIRSDSAH